MVNLMGTHPGGTPFPYSAKHLACALLYLLEGEGSDELNLRPIHEEGSGESSLDNLLEALDQEE